ncbi:acyltransferase family protein [Xylanimonas ulmi]|uniref:Peptidoglycan/LPS O-acetylase OafA/YrhL n=1 Tax=Xylanimonas ulmi TaxID=228973 RepID=A0A4Q7M5E3_9MICO|nr:acyltransferase [Xylanibacterium ulmi]RZS61862.1 peptidoglycan/LPS O-acetylase OafA/YrhL [Xylanibacterium ulmi]
MTQRSTHVGALDGLRALAVLAVIGYHSRETWMPGGKFGVSVFFVLSGYLITGILLRELERSGRIDFKRFFARRALRLFPALVVVVVIGGAVLAVLPGVAHRADSLLGALGAITYTASPIAASGEPLGSFAQTWTLSVEEYFYLFWPLLLLAIAKVFRRRMASIVTGLAVIAAVYWIVERLWSGWSTERLYYAPDTRAAGLLIGCALAVQVAEGHVKVRPWHAVLAAGFVVAEIVLPVAYVGDDLAVGVAAAVIIAAVASHGESWLAALLSRRPLTWIGRRSYGIYLWNPVLAAIVSAVVPSRLPLLPIILVLSLVVPAFSYRYVEMPFLRLKTRMDSASLRFAAVGAT